MSQVEVATEALTDDIKKQLKSTVIGLRRLLEEDLGRELRRLGIDPNQDGPAPVGDLEYLDERDKTARFAVEAALVKELEVAGTYPRAVEAVRREVAYTHLNRLVGLKCIELRGLLQLEGESTEAVTCRPEFGGRSKWLWTVRDREANYRHGEEAEELLWREGLEAVYRAISPELGILFDPDDPYAQVWPSHRALMDTVSALNELPEEGYRADEFLGWVYQYFQTEEKDRVFEEVRTKKKKISGPDIIPVTSLYTERYMVDFLLQNSIGTRWMEMYPDSKAKEAWPYYVEPATPYTRAHRPVREWTVLDPCVGSGHFLVVAFDLLVQLYAEERAMVREGQVPKDWVVPAGEVAQTILENNLHGIDIDLRSVQIAALALYLKAKENGLGSDDVPPTMNLVAADAVLARGEAYNRLIEQNQDDPAVQEAIEAIWIALENVRELGSLIRVEEEVDSAVRKVKEKEDKEAPLLSSTRDWEDYKRRILHQLMEAFEAERQNGEIADRIFRSEGRKGIGLVELLSHKYDVVCTNPPYMGSGSMGNDLKDYVFRSYPAGKRDLFAAFLQRCIELTEASCHTALVTQQSWMFLRAYAKLRFNPNAKMNSSPGIVLNTRISSLVHLGENAFSDPSAAGAFAVIFVLMNEVCRNNHAFYAFRLIGLNEKTRKQNALLASIRDKSLPTVFCPIQARFLDVLEAPLVYWLSGYLFDLLKEHSPSTKTDRTTVDTALSPHDTRRFVRYAWELSPTSIGDEYWWYTTGGGYRKWSGYEMQCVDWANDGERIKAFIRANYPEDKYSLIIKRPESFGRDGAYYAAVARGSLGVRITEDVIFSDSAPGVDHTKLTKFQLMGILNSRLQSYLLRALSATVLSIRDPYITRLPLHNSPLSETSIERIGKLSEIATQLKRQIISRLPYERRFREVELDALSTHRLEMLLSIVEAACEREVFQGYSVDDESKRLVFSETGPPVGWFPLAIGYESFPQFEKQGPETLQVVEDYWESLEIISLSNRDLESLKENLALFYADGIDFDGETPELQVLMEHQSVSQDNQAGALIPIPYESVIEMASSIFRLHPVSIFHILVEVINETELTCLPAKKETYAYYFMALILRMLGHRWPEQDQHEADSGRPMIDAKYIDEDGIIPMSSGTAEESLMERIRRFLDEQVGHERSTELERDAGAALHWKKSRKIGKQMHSTLERWLRKGFFGFQVSALKKRPIAWLLSSELGTFQVIVYYQKFTADRLRLLRARYVEQAKEALRHRLAEARELGENRKALAAIEALESEIADVDEFDQRLGLLLDGATREARIWCPWKSAEEQPVGWEPDINDGVRVNIAPVQRLGLLASNVLSKKDLDSLLAPDART